MHEETQREFQEKIARLQKRKTALLKLFRAKLEEKKIEETKTRLFAETRFEKE